MMLSNIYPINPPEVGSLKNQLGATLIGLMVGILVSMIAILGSLSLYKTLTQTTVDATFDTKNDGNAAIVLSQMATLLQNTGFGLEKEDSPHLILPLNSTSKNEVIWREAKTTPATQSAVVCKRIIEKTAIPASDGVSTSEADVPEGIVAKKIILQTLTHAQEPACHHKNSLNLIPEASWATGSQTLLSINTLSRLDKTYAKTDSQMLFQITLEALSGLPGDGTLCSPYGMTPDEHTKAINISHFSATDINSGASTPSLTYSVCLTNP